MTVAERVFTLYRSESVYFSPDEKVFTMLPITDYNLANNARNLPTNTLITLACHTIPETLSNRNPQLLSYWQNSNQIAHYGLACLEELYDRGYHYEDKLTIYLSALDSLSPTPPSWWGNPITLNYHRLYLLHSQPSWFNQFKWKVEEPLCV